MLSKSRLTRVHDVLAGHVEAGALPGAVTLVRHGDELHVDALGAMALGGDRPMRRDTIFRIASLTKPITAVATLILVEECRLRLDEPVSRLLPEFAEPRVIRHLRGPLDDTVPAARAITVRDLLTFRLGTGFDVAARDAPLVKATLELAGFPDPQPTRTPDVWLAELAELPLMAQPGERWLYNTGSDILGVLIARAAGQPLEQFLRERIFDPLGMRDTGFSVPGSELDRVATSYWVDAAGELGTPGDPETTRTTPVNPSGSGGLLSTVDDYFAFAEMLRADGRHRTGERLLSRPTVRAMTTDQIPEQVKAVSGFAPGWFDSRGWGMGVGVITRQDGLEATPGRYGWDGGTGTSWFTDPAEDLTAILLTQRGQFPLASPVYLDFWASLYQAIDD